MDLVPENAILQFSNLQKDILAAFFEAFPSYSDDFMASVPKHGELIVDGNVWTFHRHGMGVMFKNKITKIVIDAHRIYNDVPNAIDAWRFMQFLESLGVSSVNEQDIEQSLRSAVESSVLVETSYCGVYAVGELGTENRKHGSEESGSVNN